MILDNPRGRLIQVAARRMTDHLRSELARRRRELVMVTQVPADQQSAPTASLADFGSSFGRAGSGDGTDQDDRLFLLPDRSQESFAARCFTLKLTKRSF